MRKTIRKNILSFVPMLMVIILLAGAPAQAAVLDYYLQAGVTKVAAGAYNAAAPQVPNENILMWGYALCTASFGSCGSVTVPGPVLIANEGDTLRIHLKNNLTTAAGTGAGFASMITEPTSLIIPGQTTTLTPTWVAVNQYGGVTGISPSNGAFRQPGDVTSRVRSFTTETPADNSTVTTYVWSGLKPGTYLYESGTHLAVQVQMGLYGALKVYPTQTPVTGINTDNATATLPANPQAYDDASSAFKSEVTLVYSEIDQELHYSIASGLYGTPPPPPPAVAVRGQRTSTSLNQPKFFLVNGSPFISGTAAAPNPAALASGTHGQTTLIRFLNAGIKEKTPTVLNNFMTLVAEDGNPYTYQLNNVAHYKARQQYECLLPAGKTIDALISPAAAGNLPVFDRSLNMTNAAFTAGGMGGMLIYLSFN